MSGTRVAVLPAELALQVIHACEVEWVARLPGRQYTTAITGGVIHIDAGRHIEGMVFH